MSSGYERGGRTRSRRRGAAGRAGSGPGFLTWAALALVVVLVAGMLLGPPTLVSYVDSGSMAPALSTGDGFVAVPTALAGPPAVGDVVVYRAETLAGGELVTHRIVGRTDAGYVTRGDANPVTDQTAGEPPVTRNRIRAHALSVGGQVVAIPRVGQLSGQGTGPASASGGAGPWLVIGGLGLLLAGRRAG